MSDALTDIARDEERSRAFERYLEAVLSFLKGKADKTKVVAAARNCDRVPRGYWGSPTNLSDNVDDTLSGLQNRSLETWASILDIAAGEDAWETRVYRELRALSPWPGQKMRRVSFHRFHRGLSELLEPYLHQAGKATTFGGNPSGHFEYVVFLDESSTLLDIAKSAVCVAIRKTSWSLDRTIPWILPNSSSLEDLADRQKYFDGRMRY